MRRVGLASTWILLIAVLLLAGPGRFVSATSIGVPGNMPTPLPQAPPDPNLAGYNLYPFALSSVIGGPSPNRLPSGLFAESPLQFNLAMTAGFGPGGRVDPVVAPQQFNFFIIGDYWSVQAQFDYAPDTGIFHPSDVVTMTGDAVHRIAPHPGEFAPGPAVQFNVVLDAGSVLTLPPDLDIPPDALRRFIRQANLPAGARFGADLRSAVHDPGPHEDVVFGILAGQISSPNNPFVGNDLEFWVGGVGGLHPTPEPMTLVLVASSAAGLALMGRRGTKSKG